MIPTILLIEDDVNNVSLMQDIFEYDGIPAKLAVAETGEEALHDAAQLQPVLILMDLRLPGIDGLEIAQIFKDHPLTENIPIWAITAYAMPGDEERAKAAGCCQYFTKPTNMRDFIGRLRNFLGEIAAKGPPPCLSRKS